MKTIIFREIDSTNEYVRRNAEKLEHGDAAIAFSQTNGKGTQNRTFFSPPSGLYVSFVVKKSFALPMSLVTPAVGVAAVKAIKRVFGVSLGIKWVNDLYKDGKKVCGILCEKHDSSLIIGVGINVSPPENGFPGDIPEAAAIVKKNVSALRKIRLALLIRRYFFAQLKTDGKKTLALYRALSVATGKEVEVFRGEERTEGVAAYITDEGYLVVDTKDGEKIFASGTLRIK